MTYKYEFRCKEEHWATNIDDEILISVVSGDIGNLLEREDITDVLDYENIVYDNEYPNIFTRTNKLSLIKGKLKTTYFLDSNPDINSNDVTKLIELGQDDKIRNGDFTEEQSDNIYTTTYKFGADYDVIGQNSYKYMLKTKTQIEALEDDTRLFCLIPKNENYLLDILDIDINETKTINRDYNDKNIKYLFFSQNCSVGETNINQYETKKFTSNSVDVTNNSDEILRIFLMSR